MRDFVIKPLNQACMDACQLRVDNLTKPIYSLAQLEKIAVRLAGIYNVEQPNHIKNGVLILPVIQLLTVCKTIPKARKAWLP